MGIPVEQNRRIVTMANDPAATNQESAAEQIAPDNLALFFQELFTEIVRLRSSSEDVNAEQVRSQMIHAIRIAEQNGKARGYTDGDISLFAAYKISLGSVVSNLQLSIGSRR
jgi:type VI protein secretion system component VasF